MPASAYDPLGELSDFGGLLEKATGGRALKGLLAGKPRELASVIPFSDRMGLTDPSQATTGRDLTDLYHLTQKGDTGLGSRAIGFGADVLANPLSLLGGVQAFRAAPTVAKGLGAAAKAMTGADLLEGAVRSGGKALRGAGGLLKGQEGWLNIHGFPHPVAPYDPKVAEILTGIKPEHMGFLEAAQHYDPWIKSLTPEEAISLKLYTGGPQAKISHAYRGRSSTVGGSLIDPFKETGSPGSAHPGAPILATHEDVMKEVDPYLSSALSRTGTPKDVMTHRLSGQLGELSPRFASKLVGETVSDPSPLSTTISPWGAFYGREADPRTMLLDILMRKGTQGGYVHPLSRWEQEKELLLPPGSQFLVKDVSQVPVRKLGWDWNRLDPAGRPIPRPLQGGGGPSEVFTENAAKIFHDQIVGQGKFGPQALVPEELLAPHWRELMAGAPEATQTNVLLEMLGGGVPPHLPNVRRLTPQEMWDQVQKAVAAVPPQKLEALGIRNFARSLAREAKHGGYPEHGYLEELRNSGLPIPELYRSIPRGQ